MLTPSGLLQRHRRILLRGPQRVQKLLEEVRRESRLLPLSGGAEHSAPQDASVIARQLFSVCKRSRSAHHMAFSSLTICLLFCSLHRYSGKTQKQIIEFVRDNYVKRQTFQRFANFLSFYFRTKSQHQ